MLDRNTKLPVIRIVNKEAKEVVEQQIGTQRRTVT
jgi:hypothetical protein